MRTIWSGAGVCALGLGAALLSGDAAEANPYGWRTIERQSCANTQWTEKTLRATPTKRGRKRALRRARRQWERGVRKVIGADYASLDLARNVSQYCTRQGECFVSAIPCASNWDK
ncbi:MAG: hypothetical protein AAGM38_13350 [Pseudomonadota bacterium]